MLLEKYLVTNNLNAVQTTEQLTRQIAGHYLQYIICNLPKKRTTEVSFVTIFLSH